MHGTYVSQPSLYCVYYSSLCTICKFFLHWFLFALEVKAKELGKRDSKKKNSKKP